MKKLLIVCLLAGYVLVAILIRSEEPEPNSVMLPNSQAENVSLDRERDNESMRTRVRPRRNLLHSLIPAIPANPPADPDEARQWARENLEQAMAWLIAAPPGADRDTVAEMVCARVAESDPAEAVALAERYAGGCSNLLENLVHQWAKQDEPAARAYALAKPTGDERDRLLSRVALVQSKTDPLAAATLVVEQIAPGEVQNEAALSVLQQWGAREPAGAIAWAQTFDDALRDRAMNEAAVQLQNED